MNDEIILEIEGNLIPCKKCILIENSEYFRAMFSGNFLESQQNSVKIDGVDTKSINIILMFLWDHTYVIKDEDLLSVLRTSLMLQFTKIKKVCESKILETLKPSNCLRVWRVTDQQLSPLDLKAKCLALEEFSEVLETDQIFELNLEEICIYLGHTNLRVKDEFDVFQTLMKWWYENSKSYDALQATIILLRLLNCLDFKTVTKENINEMKTYPDVCDNDEIISLLNCILCIKTNGDITEFSEQHKKYALTLVKESKSRRVLEFPCIILEPFSKMLGANETDESEDGQETIVFRDRFGRKRKYDKLTSNKSISSESLESMLGLLYEPSTKSFREFFEIQESKCKGLIGFEILPYKEFILLFGGEVSLGNGNWNTNLWMYDTFREKWERRSVLPYYRRHFETCRVGSCLYLVGGIGRFRLVQDNLFYYDIKRDKWSETISLPTTSRQIKCCSYKDQLFILSLPNQCGYLFNQQTQYFRKIPLILDQNKLDHLETYYIFFWMNDFYILGNYIYKFQLQDDKLKLVHSQPHLDFSATFCKAVICNDTVYCFGTSTLTNQLFLNTLDLKNLNIRSDTNNFTLNLRTWDTSDEDGLSKRLIFGDASIYPISRLCSFHHYEFVKDNVLVNDFNPNYIKNKQ